MVVNGSVYVVSTDGYVRAINRTTGALNWETPIPDCSGFQLGNPAYGNGKIFVPTADSRIFAFDAWTGTELWNDSVESNKPSSSSLYHQLNTPVVYDNGRIYFGQWIPANYAGKYYCYTEDGTEVWNRDCTNGNKGYYWAGATVVGDYLVFGGDDGYLTSLYKVNGTLVDEINIGAGEIRSTLVYDEESNRIFTSTKNGYCISIEMNPEGTFNDSSKVQSASFDAQSTSTPVIYNGRVYLGSGNFQASSPFFCLNSTDLSVIWRFTGTNGGIQSSPVVSTAYDDGDGEVYIYFTTNARYSRLYCLKDNATNTNMTSEEWYFQPEDSKNQYTLQGVALVGGWLYYGNDKGYLFGLAGVQNGSEIPVADFNAAPLSGNSPLTVNFTDDSTGSPTSWFWDFGDGTNSTEQNPSYTYTSAGNYTVNLTVANAAGSDSEVKTDYISVSEPLPSAPVANFSADITSGVGPLAVQFTESSTGSPTAWEWDFNNDGNVDSTEQNPQFIYTGEGTYSVKLTVTNSEGNDSELKIDYISVVYPSPDFIANVTEGTVPLTVEFTGNVSGLAPDYWNMWAWDVDGDGTYDYSPNFNITHTYTEPGTYDVVVAYDGWTPNVKAGYITVLPEIPVANFSADVTSGLEPLTVNFTDQSEGIVSSYSWDFDNDGTVDSIEQNPSYTYESAGNYTVSLTVSNAGGSDSELKTDYIVVSEPVPEAPVANFTATPTAGNAPLTVNFTDQSEGIVSSYSWDFDNDGNVDSTEQNPSHTYESAGNYTVSLTVSNAGGSDSELKTDYITVSSTPVEPEPVAAFTADVTGGTAPLTVNFTDQSTGSPTAWAWDFGDGANSTEQNPSHTYVSAGNYTVNLTVENAAGMDFELKTNYIEVSETSGSTVTLYFDPESSSVSENESTEINIVASNFPAGLSGYNLTVAIDDPVVAEIVDIAYPTWALISENSTLPATSIYMKTVDLEDAVKEGATDVVLATLTVSGKEKGSANLSIGVKRLEEDSGDSIEPALLAGTIEVTLLSPLPDQEYAPKDLDGDGLYEDLTGNGEFSFVDIVAYFHNMDWIEENMPVEYFDFNGNGRIDFDDVVRMFGMI
ncbi:TPA: PKD domain-containing protein [Methanosarcina acetivorans]|uniref:PKD domain-containing protein n=1 Tax=Methanosarcina acetivorans TaxID=2214 RepID=A0A832SIG7_9EURY|nr:PKD domain-containing protein [Methanosarcina acetivorans]